MKYVRYRNGAGAAYGLLDGDAVRELRGDLFDHEETGVTHAIAGLQLLHPIQPGQILCVGRNYQSHLGERKAPARPEMFLKSVSSLIGPGAPIVIPAEASNVHYESELVLVIGTRLKRASVEQAHDGIFGVTCGNDACDRVWQHGPDKDMQWWRSKSADTFGPLGPCVVTGIDYGNLLIQTRLNGEIVTRESTADMIFDGPTIVSFVSQWMTLERGDVIYTGTPDVSRQLHPGDTIEVEIEGIGVLRNPVVAEA
jgi:2-keto-4-pentenoate hydratase/2-oxohepta-3-ene-1,7-dioic acid hydratase in catechol pathway